jgi:hypothetical protein
MIAVLAAIVAAQAIALALLIRRPPAMPTPPSVVVASEPSPALAIAPQPDPAAQTPAATTLSVTGATGATVFIDGERRGVSPLTVSGLASGRHQVRIATADGSASQDVTLAAGSSASVLFPTPRSGWIDIRTPFRVTVNEGARQIAVSGDGPVSLSAGAHTLTLRNDDLGYRYDARVTVAGGDMAVIRPPVPQGVLQVNALPWANVYVDGEPAGDTPIGQLRVPLGSHEVRFVHPQYGERLVRVTVGAQSPARVSVDLR